MNSYALGQNEAMLLSANYDIYRANQILLETKWSAGSKGVEFLVVNILTIRFLVPKKVSSRVPLIAAASREDLGACRESMVAGTTAEQILHTDLYSSEWGCSADIYLGER